MPLCPIPIGIGHPDTWNEWRMIDHLSHPMPFAYILPPEFKCHTRSPLAKSVIFEFPHLAQLEVDEPSDWKIRSFPSHTERADASAFIYEAMGVGSYAVGRTAANLMEAAAVQLVVAYCTHGAGRHDKQVVAAVFGGPLYVAETKLASLKARSILTP